MKVFFKLFIIFITVSPAANSHAFPELPFWPAGGPPGWMNHFNYKRNKNIWRHYSQYTSPAYYRPNYRYGYTPAYRTDYYRPYHNYNQNNSQLRTVTPRSN